MSPRKRRRVPGPHGLAPDKLRWRCDPKRFSFETTAELGEAPIDIIGQPRAQEALRVGLCGRAAGTNVFVSGMVGCGRSTVVKRALAELAPDDTTPDDLVYVHNFEDPDRPCRMFFPAGRGKLFRQTMDALIDNLGRDLRKLFDSEPYRKRRTAHVEMASAGQKAKLKEFEKRVQDAGFNLVQVQMGPFVRSRLVPVVAGNPVEVEALEQLVEQGGFKRAELDELLANQGTLQAELELLGKEVHRLEHDLRAQLQEFDRELAGPLVEEATRQVQQAFRPEELKGYMEKVGQEILDNLEDFRQHPEGDEDGGEEATRSDDGQKYRVNLLVDNSQIEGRPVIWEGNPSYRNLFGTVDRARSETGEWETDHRRIKSGSLLRANGGFLVLDAMDVLVAPGVWPALKRTLRHCESEIQSIDPALYLAGAALNPEPVPIDVKVIMIGTHQIYHLLHAHDEDFQKIFKVKADFAMHTQLNDHELGNYARLINKRCETEQLPPFHREAVAAVVEYGARIADNRDKLTTRFNEVVDLVREAGYWAKQQGSKRVEGAHVDLAEEKRNHRMDLVEELLRERIADGTVLLDIEGRKVGQINGLALLDQGDHVFALPSRITATTAMGRSGIIDIDHEAEMSGAIHTKGVLILTGFLRARFARTRPLTLTASICFEQNYGGIDGDSASSAELYVLLSALSGVPLRQGIAVTGSINQRGEIQPIGGANRKIEGFFDLCKLQGLTGEQGVMMPTRNLSQLMLRKDVVEAVEKGRFHVWAVSSVEEGLEVLTDGPVGVAAADGAYAPDSIFGKADAELKRLAEEVGRYGPADVAPV